MSHPTWRDPKYLLDMLLAANDALGVVADLTQVQFEQNRTAQLAAAHAPQIIGEAANRVSRQTQELHPQIPWRQMIGMRNHLVHDYGHVDPEIVWDTLQRHVPELIAGLKPPIPPE